MGIGHFLHALINKTTYQIFHSVTWKQENMYITSEKKTEMY